MAFDEVRLPEDIERGAAGGPGFKTSIIVLVSGHEKRRSVWQKARGRWDIGYGIDKKSKLEAVIEFFYARNGAARGFRFKDWSDFQVGTEASPQEIGTGDGMTVAFQIFKRYTSGAVNYDRTLTKIVPGTEEIYVGGVLQTGGGTDYTLDDDTGIITFTTAPPSMDAVTVYAEFDVPVRFESDDLTIATEVFTSEAIIEVPRIGIIELRQD